MFQRVFLLQKKNKEKDVKMALNEILYVQEVVTRPNIQPKVS